MIGNNDKNNNNKQTNKQNNKTTKHNNQKATQTQKHPITKPITRELGSCVKVEVAVLGSPSLIVLTVSVDVKQH